MRLCVPILLAAFLASALPAWAQSAVDHLFAPKHEAALSPDFVSAMTRGRHGWYLRGDRPLSISFLWLEPVPTGIPFYWEAADGSSIRRVGDGGFRIDAADPQANWTSTIDCIPAGWPQFLCTDGETHRMSAPDLSTLVVGSRTFGRMMPEPPMEDAIDPEQPQ